MTASLPTRSLLAGLLAGLLLTAAAAGQAPQQLWIINTRHAPSCRTKEAVLDYRQRDEQNCWAPSDAESFHQADDPSTPTVFFFHGYQVDSCTAIREGMSLFGVLRRFAPERPMRYVIWSWPTVRCRGRIRDDARGKAARSDVDGYYFAQCLDRMDPRVPVGAVGHSYGARIITGAMELLAGGTVAGRSLEERDRPPRPIRAVLVAAALDNGALLPGWRHGQALGPLESLLVTQNTRDRVLKWYPFLYGRGGPEALGRTGPACPGRLGPDRQKLEVLGLSCSVGSGHAWNEYLASSALRHRLNWYAFRAEGEPDESSSPDGEELPDAGQEHLDGDGGQQQAHEALQGVQSAATQ